MRVATDQQDEKITAWVSTSGVYGARDHHDEWNVKFTPEGWCFDTSSEAAYPALLAQRATACLVDAAHAKGLTGSTDQTS